MSLNKTIMLKEIFQQPEVIKDCFKFNQEILIELSKKIKSSEISTVVIAARGTSDHVAIFAKYLFEIYYNIPVSLAAPSVFTKYNSTIDMSKCLVIGISQSGAAEDVLEVINSANKSNAITVGITNTLNSPIHKGCSHHLYCCAGKEESVAATKTFSSQLFLILNLISLISTDKDLKRSIDFIENSIKYATTLYEQIKETAKIFKFVDECFVLSRGLAYPIAMESALKIQETSYTRARCYATSDFHHGPFAMINKNIPVIIIGVDPKVESDIIEMINKLKSEDVFILSISNSKDIWEKSDISFKIEDHSFDTISNIFIATVISQIFSCELAILKGNDPDNPKGLKKVTITR